MLSGGALVLVEHKISQRVNDLASVILLRRFNHVRMMSYYERGSGIYRGMCKLDLCG